MQVVDLVLATDMKQHFSVLSTLKAALLLADKPASG